MNKKKKVYLDALRIIAAGCVIYNHLPAINLFTDTKGLEQCLYMIITLFIILLVFYVLYVCYTVFFSESYGTYILLTKSG